jgi:hypothetical protein
MNFKQFLESSLDDLFNKDMPERKILSGTKSEPSIIECYRGFKANLSGLEKEGDNFILSPKKSQEGFIWFTHELQSNWLVEPNPKEYAAGHARGGYLLTYPLQCIRHYYLIEGPYGPREECPEEIKNKVTKTGKSRFGNFGACYELPEGWFFTWQTEKHIGCDKKIKISPKMLTPV